jgi:ubiquinone/menaquinone biosynthesis C-methylase UbiE
MELAQLSGGHVVGIDTDLAELCQLRRRIEQAGPSHRVTAVNCSLYETGFPDESFDIVWGEGVFHLLDSSRSFRECYRLLKPHGFLVIHEAVTWFEEVRKQLPAFGFQHLGQRPLPKHCWWTDYGAPLKQRIRNLRKAHGSAAESAELARYEREVATLKEAPGKFDCAFFILEKRAAPPNPMTV